MTIRYLFTLTLALAIAVAPATTQAAEGRTELWLSLSASLLLGGIAGSYALKVAAMNDRMEMLPLEGRQRWEAQDDAMAARRLAWGFGAGASLMALTTVLVWVYLPTQADKPQPPAAGLNPVLGAGQLGVNYNGRF